MITPESKTRKKNIKIQVELWRGTPSKTLFAQFIENHVQATPSIR